MTKVKICGITNLEDARHAIGSGADMLGFNFYDKSQRYISPTAAREVAGELPRDILVVGVFVNMEAYRINEFVEMVGLDAVQIHGDEDEGFFTELRTKTSAQIIKTVRLRTNDIVDDTARNGADFLLLDAYSDGLYGGSGQSFDWNAARGIDGLILAGGLNPENVGNAIRTVRPYAVDVASGVESTTRKKDPDKVAAFIKAAKEAL